MIRKAAVVGALLVCLGGCGSNSVKVSASPSSLHDAAKRTVSQDSAKYTFNVALRNLPAASNAKVTFSMSGDGLMRFKDKVYAVNADISDLNRALQASPSTASATGDKKAQLEAMFGKDKISFVIQGDAFYTDFPLLTSVLGGGDKPWVKAKRAALTQLAQDTHLEGLLQSLADPTQVIRDFANASFGFVVPGSVKDAGNEDVRGTATTHFTSRADFLKVAQDSNTKTLVSNLFGGQDPVTVAQQSGVKEIPIELWIDKKGIVRKMTMSFDPTGAGAQSFPAFSLTFELFEVNTSAQPTLPAAGDVADRTSSP